MADDSTLISRTVDLVRASDVPAALATIRPTWQAKNLIVRVRRLLDVDPSSACQRLLNAAIHDLREKIAIAGIDIAAEAARQHKLPPVAKPDDIENYSTSHTIDLAYRMGLLSRPNWRRVCRCYEIRRDLEHEDDEYEAGPEDCLYIFKTCIEVILSVDPIHLLRVTDVKELIEQATPAAPADSLVQDFAHAPHPRQEEICKFLISIALDGEKSDIVQQNAYLFLTQLAPHVHDGVKLNLATNFQERIGRTPLDRRHARVAIAAGVFPYLRQVQIADFYQVTLSKMREIRSHWDAYREHGSFLRGFREVGGLLYCPVSHMAPIVKWMVLTYIGTSGGRTSYGNIRHVFYSNTAAPIIEQLVADAKIQVAETLRNMADDRDVETRCQDPHIARRFEQLLDLLDT